MSRDIVPRLFDQCYFNTSTVIVFGRLIPQIDPRDMFCVQVVGGQFVMRSFFFSRKGVGKILADSFSSRFDDKKKYSKV